MSCICAKSTAQQQCSVAPAARAQAQKPPSRPVPIDPHYWSPFWSSYSLSLLPTCSLKQHVDNITQQLYPDVWQHLQVQQAQSDQTDEAAGPHQGPSVTLCCASDGLSTSTASKAALQAAAPIAEATEDVAGTGAAINPAAGTSAHSPIPLDSPAAPSTTSAVTTWSSELLSGVVLEDAEDDWGDAGASCTVLTQRSTALHSKAPCVTQHSEGFMATHMQHAQEQQPSTSTSTSSAPARASGTSKLQRCLCCCACGVKDSKDINSQSSSPWPTTSSDTTWSWRSDSRAPLTLLGWQQREAAQEAALNQAWRHRIAMADLLLQLYRSVENASDDTVNREGLW